MTLDTLKYIEKFEADLWEAADNLRANSKLTSSDYFMPVLGIIFFGTQQIGLTPLTSRSKRTRPPKGCRSGHR